MLAELVSTSITSLNLGARDHAALAAGSAEIYRKVMKRDGHVCHVCGSRCHDALEMDHLAGHKKSKPAELRSICQFCHNLKHPLWAGARKKFVPILCSDLTQSDLHRLAWVLLAWRGVDNAPFDVAKVIDMIERRRAAFEDFTGCSSAEALFEAAMTVSDPEQIGRKKTVQVLTGMDQYVRFWPSELTPEHESLDPATRLSRWDIGGFRLINAEVAEKIRADLKPDPEKIMALMEQVGEN